MKEKIKELVQEIGISEIESILEELKSETTCCKEHRNWFYESAKNILKSKKCSCDNKPAAREWFHNYLMGVSIYKKENYPESLFFKNNDGHNVMEQDYENDRLWVNYYRIWSVFKSKYDLKYEEIRDLIYDMVSDTFKIKVSTPTRWISHPILPVSETFKIKVSTPAYEGLF